jgi:HAD superfamily hydrolase (TIGR01509 family)
LPFDLKYMITTQLVKGVVFDLDGVLVETERMYCAAFRGAAASFGWSVSDDETALIVGLADELAVAVLTDKLGPHFPAARILARMQTLVSDNKSSDIAARPGANVLVSRLASLNVPIAVATSSRQDVAIARLRNAGLYDKCDGVFGRELYASAKPSPDAYLAACAHLRLKPDECIAFEDSPTGMRAAVSAGMKAVFVEDMLQADAFIHRNAFAMLKSLEGLV